MTYELSRRALKELGRDTRFKDNIRYYNFRRNFTSQERQRVLSRVTLYLKSTISYSLLDAISNILFFFDRLRMVYYASLAVYLGREIYKPYLSLPIRLSGLFINIREYWS
ncbi:hypothetical protein NUU61_008588 [Penicillium alfredii]|uniref:Uncharacterized protein n=1 Tax=Penicillium alfredii TaxID=1506179 RepID=A0A9W9ELP6_9EURO|nr:uncharacterized protein NUU61_008588 [Penicillium alfredii]KAJ5084009.1 hypothetical protein NUU61_008588 [Penicillium alfredii]